MKRSNRGFTLLLAALTASIVLALGASIFVIAKKELLLASLGRDSQYAFYAADQAAECALYWDARFSFFGTSTPPALVAPNDPTCDGQHWKNPADRSSAPGGVSGGSRPSYPYWVTFQYSPTSPLPTPPGGTQSYCVNVTVYKCDGTINTPSNGSYTCTSQVPAVVHTTVRADGYSTNCATLTTNPRTLQRSVELHY